jgi:hypothetical protein
MIGIGLNIGNRVMGGGGAAFDVDAQAFFDRVTAAGGTLTTTEQNATNQLVLDMKSAGIWSSMKAVYPMVGASAAACAQNLKSSSFTGTFTSGWTFASTGVTPNGTSAYMDTGFNPSLFTANYSTHLSYYSRTDVNGASLPTAVDIGVSGPAGSSYLPIIYFRSRSNDLFDVGFYNYGSPTNFNSSNTSSLGLFVGNRTSNVVVNSWKNGIKQATDTDTETQNITTVTKNVFLSCLNLDGFGAQFSSRQCAFASIGDGLTDTQASNFYTAVNSFQVSLSRNV